MEQSDHEDKKPKMESDLTMLVAQMRTTGVGESTSGEEEKTNYVAVTIPTIIMTMAALEAGGNISKKSKYIKFLKENGFKRQENYSFETEFYNNLTDDKKMEYVNIITETWVHICNFRGINFKYPIGSMRSDVVYIHFADVIKELIDFWNVFGGDSAFLEFLEENGFEVDPDDEEYIEKIEKFYDKMSKNKQKQFCEILSEEINSQEY